MRPTPKSAASRSRKVARIATSLSLDKAPSGIAGLDEITGGGLPRGRPTLVCGGAGCGKTLFAMEFLVRGAIEYGEPGVFMSFEETEEELAKNVASLGFDLRQLIAQKKLAIDHVRVERNEIEETGEYDLEGLFVRLRHAIDSVGAKRVVLDTIESLFARLPNAAILRSELRRLFRWLKDQGVTAIITGEQGEGTLTRQGLEEYVSDCVIFLDHRVDEQISTRRLRVVKYRGSTHGTNEYPFLIDETGISVLPITSLGLDHPASSERVSTGIPRLDEMLGGGYFKGTTILCLRHCRHRQDQRRRPSGARRLRAGRALPVLRLRGIVRPDRAQHALHRHRPRALHRERQLLRPRGLAPARPGPGDAPGHHAQGGQPVRTGAGGRRPGLQPRSASGSQLGSQLHADPADRLSRRPGASPPCSPASPRAAPSSEQTEVGISSLIDTWLMLDVVRGGGERNRTLDHRQVARHGPLQPDDRVPDHGPGRDLLDTYLGPSGVLTGSARLASEARTRRRRLAAKRRSRASRRCEGTPQGLRGRLAALQANSPPRTRNSSATSRNGSASATAPPRTRRHGQEPAGLRADAEAPGNGEAQREARGKGTPTR